MATDQCIDETLQVISAVFNKTSQWRETVYHIWWKTFLPVVDRDLETALDAFCTRQYEYKPNNLLADFKAEVEKHIKLSGGTGLARNEFVLCEDCIQLNGMREVVATFMVLETGEYKTKKDWKLACTCKGAQEMHPNSATYIEIEDRMKQDRRIHLKNFHFTHRGMPIMRQQYREPERWARNQRHFSNDNMYMKLVELYKLQAQQKQQEAERNNPPDSIF